MRYGIWSFLRNCLRATPSPVIARSASDVAIHRWHDTGLRLEARMDCRVANAPHNDGKLSCAHESIGACMAVFILCLSSSAICSNSDPEKIPLLANMPYVNNDNNAINHDSADQVQRQQPLEEVVVDLTARCPRGILLPRETGVLCRDIGRDPWINILSRLEQRDLMSMRLVNPFFHRLLTQPGATNNPMGEEFLINLAESRLNAHPFDDNVSLAVRMADIWIALVNLRNNERLTDSLKAYFIAKLQPHARQLWRLRYAPGMNRDDLRHLLNELNLPEDNSWRSWLDARQLASIHHSRAKGGLTEAAKAAFVCGSTAITLWLTWSKPFQPASTCQTVYMLPAQFLGDIVQAASGDLAGRIGSSVFVGLSLLLYLPTWFKCDLADAHGKAVLKFRAWGKTPTYDQWLQLIQKRDDPRSVRARLMLSYVIAPALAATLIGMAGYSYLDLGLTTVITGQETIARYIHEELKYNFAKNASCCAIAIDSYLGGSCPFVDANNVPDFGLLIAKAAVVSGYAGIDILSFSLASCQVLFVFVLTLLNFL